MLTDKELQAIRDRHTASTQGRWDYITDSCDCGGGYPCGHYDWAYEIFYVTDEPDPEWGDGYKAFCTVSEGKYRHPVFEDMRGAIEDAEFTVNAHDDIPKLLDMIEDLKYDIKIKNNTAELTEEHITRLAARIQKLTKENARFRKALEYIKSPITHMEKEAKEKGYRLDGGMAVALASDAEHLRAKAIHALEFECDI